MTDALARAGDAPESVRATAPLAGMADLLIRSILPLLLALVAGGALIGALGHNPFSFYLDIYRGGIELTRSAKDLLAKRGYDPVLGARPLRRTIQREVEDMLSEKILFGEVRPGQIVLVDTEGEGDEAVFTFVGEDKASLPDEPLVEAAAAPTTPPEVAGPVAEAE